MYIKLTGKNILMTFALTVIRNVFYFCYTYLLTSNVAECSNGATYSKYISTAALNECLILIGQMMWVHFLKQVYINVLAQIQLWKKN